MSGPEFLAPDDLGTPPGYSHVVAIPAGRLVWTSGQVALDAGGNLPADAGWEGQTRLAFENVGRALDAGGARWPDVVKLTIYVTDRGRARDDPHGARRLRRPRAAAHELAGAGRRPRAPRAAHRGRGGGVASLWATRSSGRRST